MVYQTSLALSQEVSDIYKAKIGKKSEEKCMATNPNVWDEALTGSSRWRFYLSMHLLVCGYYAWRPIDSEFNLNDSPDLAPKHTLSLVYILKMLILSSYQE